MFRLVPPLFVLLSAALFARSALAQPATRFVPVTPGVVGSFVQPVVPPTSALVQPVTPTPSPFIGVPPTVPSTVNPAINPTPGTGAVGATAALPSSLGNVVPSPLPYPGVGALPATGYQVTPVDLATLSAIYNTNAASLLTVPSSVVPFSAPSEPTAVSLPATAPQAPAASVVYVVVPSPATASVESEQPAAAAPTAPPLVEAPTPAPTTTVPAPSEEAPVEAPAASPASPAPVEAPAPNLRVRPEIVLGTPAAHERAPSPPAPVTPPSASVSMPKAPASPAVVVALVIGGAALGATLMGLGTRWRRLAHG